MKSLSILIAEDEVLTREDIKDILQRAGHVVCAECGNGLKAVEQAKEKRPDLAILDIKMPGLDGIEVAKVLHGLSIPVVMVTAFSQPGIISRAENVYVSGYLVKPVSEHNLLATVRIAYARWRELTAMHRELSVTKGQLEGQKLIARARSIIADREKLTQQEAHTKLTQEAMRRQLSIIELAKRIIAEK
jgi:AmiR/NasT family two-component response regulator